MSLTDIMSASGLSRFAEIALVIFVVVFGAVFARTFLPGRRAELERAGRMPLEDQAAGAGPRSET